MIYKVCKLASKYVQSFLLYQNNNSTCGYMFNFTTVLLYKGVIRVCRVQNNYF